MSLNVSIVPTNRLLFPKLINILFPTYYNVVPNINILFPYFNVTFYNLFLISKKIPLTLQMSHEEKKTMNLVTYSESEQDYSAELFDDNTQQEKVQSNMPLDSVKEKRTCNSETDNAEHDCSAEDEKNSQELRCDIKEKEEVKGDHDDRDEDENNCEEDEADKPDKEEIEGLGDENQRNSEDNEKDAPHNDDYVIWPRYQRNSVDRLYMSDSDMCTIFNSNKKKGTKRLDDYRIQYYRKNRAVIAEELRSDFECDIMMKWHLAKKRKNQCKRKREDSSSSEDEDEEESDDNSSFNSDTSDESSESNNDDDDASGSKSAKPEGGEMDEQRDFDDGHDDRGQGGPEPSSSASEQKSNTIYQVDATSYDGDDEEESDFTRFYKESEPKCSIDQNTESTKKIRLKIEDIDVHEEIDVTVEEAIVLTNIVNYADSDDKESTTTCNIDDNDSQFENREEDTERIDDKDSDNLPRPFAYDAALKHEISKKTLTYSEQLSQEGNTYFFIYN